MQFRHFDVATFLREYWQQRPLLIRNPWTAWVNPLEPDELAGLACESEVESRLVVRTGGNWSLEHGPIPEARFGELGPAGWTLLVQAVDHHVGQVAALIEPFRFIPDWQIDDVMVSYAADQGGVGPHFDQYDVFLVQGLGRRRWRVGRPCDDAAPLLPHDDLRLLEQFEAVDEWVLEPGDILYLPPRFAHDGVALGDDCMTYSIGFRAPARSELIAAWCDDVLSGLDVDDRYAGPALPVQDNPGEISPAAIDRLHAMVTESLLDRDAFARTVGRHTTTPKYPDADWRPQVPFAIDDLRAMLGDGEGLCRNPASRFSFVTSSPGLTLLFADGECFECRDEAGALARSICAADRGQDRVDIAPELSEPALVLLCALCNQGSLGFEDDD